jgi:hypothetical protein
MKAVMNIKIGLYEGTVFNLEMKNDFIVIKKLDRCILYVLLWCFYRYNCLYDSIDQVSEVHKTSKHRQR